MFGQIPLTLLGVICLNLFCGLGYNDARKNPQPLSAIEALITVKTALLDGAQVMDVGLWSIGWVFLCSTSIVELVPFPVFTNITILAHSC
jgi:hypothetical protein